MGFGTMQVLDRNGVSSDRISGRHGTGFGLQRVLGRHDFLHWTSFGSGLILFRFGRYFRFGFYFLFRFDWFFRFRFGSVSIFLVIFILVWLRFFCFRLVGLFSSISVRF
ncbi:hypothetical protein Hanom_Chr00s000001g01597411 [Helianthus anomalus]